MKRLAIAAVGLALVVALGLVSCTTEVVRVVIATPTVQQPTPEKKATPEKGEPTGQAELPEEVALPSDFPSDMIPIPSGARVVRAECWKIGDRTDCTVVYFTKEDPESIASFYDNNVPGGGWRGDHVAGLPPGVVGLCYSYEGGGCNLSIYASRSKVEHVLEKTYEGYTGVHIAFFVGQ